MSRARNRLANLASTRGLAYRTEQVHGRHAVLVARQWPEVLRFDVGITLDEAMTRVADWLLESMPSNRGAPRGNRNGVRA